VLLNLEQLSRVACLLSDAEADVAHVTESPTHHLDRTVFVRVDGRPHVIDASGREIPCRSYVLGDDAGREGAWA